MTARQVIDEIKTMPVDERQQVAEFFRQLEAVKSANEGDGRAFDELADRILDRHAPLMRKLAS